MNQNTIDRAYRHGRRAAIDQKARHTSYNEFHHRMAWLRGYDEVMEDLHRAFQEGLAQCQAGRTKGGCPHLYDPLRRMWLDGFDSGMPQQRRRPAYEYQEGPAEFIRRAEGPAYAANKAQEAAELCFKTLRQLFGEGEWVLKEEPEPPKERFTEGSVDAVDESADVFHAGINDENSPNGAWLDRIECYGHKKEDAEALRDLVLAGLRAMLAKE